MKRRRKIVHQQIYRKGFLGATLNTTFCGRMSCDDDGMNVGGRVNCKLCLRKLRAQSERRAARGEPPKPSF